MIIDDDAAVAEITSAALSKAGCSCTIANQTEDLLNQIRNTKPNVVIVDIMMPQIDGLELCRQIKNDTDLTNVKVIILSGKAYDFDKRRAREMGADGYVVKPIVPDTFVTTVLEAAAGIFTVKYWGVRGTFPFLAPTLFGMEAIRPVSLCTSQTTKHSFSMREVELKRYPRKS